jgi:UPF0755 protein
MKKAGAALLIVVILAGAGAYLLYSRVTTPFRAYTSDEQFVSVASGLGTTSIGKRLIDAGVVRDEITFRAALWLSGDARRLQAGDYRFDRPMSALEVVDKIARGDVDVQTLTLPEGLTIVEMAELFATNGLGTAASFVTAARNAALIQDIDPAARDLEGYLFPDTYRLPRGSDAEALVKLMVAQFRSVVTEQVRADASAHGLSARQLVTLASMVEKETSRADERKVVAAVYLNRLREGMPMQCDPTVIYALARVGRYTGNLRRDDLMFDSLYNTYRYPGLPPGPIAAPGRASLEASARPDSVDYLYFVSRNDGSHVFARTLTEHNRNVQTYQVEFFRAGRAGGPGGGASRK